MNAWDIFPDRRLDKLIDQRDRLVKALRECEQTIATLGYANLPHTRGAAVLERTRTILAEVEKEASRG